MFLYKTWWPMAAFAWNMVGPGKTRKCASARRWRRVLSNGNAVQTLPAGRQHLSQRYRHFGNGSAEIARLGLAEQAKGGIPRRRWTIDAPAPIGRAAQQDPGGQPQAARHMSGGAVDGDDHIHFRHQHGGVGKIL